MVVLATGVHHKTFDVSLPNETYSRITAACWGFGYSSTAINPKKPVRFGTLVSFQYMCIGYSDVYLDTYSRHRVKLNLWSWGTLSEKLFESDSMKEIACRFEMDNCRALIKIPVLEKPINWQTTIMEKIDSAYTDSQCGLTILITSSPGCGKSAIATLIADKYSDGYGIVTTADKFLNAMYYVGTTAVILFDEFDVMIRGAGKKDDVDGVACKAEFNQLCDVIHANTAKQIVMYLSNRRFTELCELARGDADSMFREGRIDMIYNIEDDHTITEVRSFRQTAKIAPKPKPVQTPPSLTTRIDERDLGAQA